MTRLALVLDGVVYNVIVVEDATVFESTNEVYCAQFDEIVALAEGEACGPLWIRTANGFDPPAE